MTNLERFLMEEAEFAEATKDAPIPPETRISRPGGQRARIYSVRLLESEVAALEAAAERAGIPASTLAHSRIAERLERESRKA